MNNNSDKSIVSSEYWRFICDPTKWKIDEFIESSEVNTVREWVTSRAKGFEYGQRGVIYVGNDKRTKKQLKNRNRLEPGIYGMIEILSNVNPNTKIIPDRFWADDTEEKIGNVVKIRFLKYTLTPIKYSLERSYGGSIMKLKSKDFEEIENRFREKEQIFERAVLENADSFDEIIELEEKYKNAAPNVKDIISKRIERGAISNKIKRHNKYRCKICEALGESPLSFKKRNGEYYIETHHIDYVSNLKNGSLSISNLITVCANHHRQIHYGNIEVENGSSVLKLKIDDRAIQIDKINLLKDQIGTIP